MKNVSHYLESSKGHTLLTIDLLVILLCAHDRSYQALDPLKILKMTWQAYCKFLVENMVKRYSQNNIKNLIDFRKFQARSKKLNKVNQDSRHS